MKHIRIHKQHGDTIVEVMIATAIISLVLAVSYATSSRALADIRQSQEHSEAMQIAQGQLEQLRALAGTGPQVFTYSKAFCLNNGLHDATNPTQPVYPFSAVNSGIGVDNLSTYTTDATTGCSFNNGINYNTAIERQDPLSASRSDYVFSVHVRWENIRGNGNDEVILRYKLNR